MANLKFDQARVISLADKNLLVATAQGDFRIVQIKFDQAQIDVADVQFFKLDS